jgi:hypothetical protein
MIYTFTCQFLMWIYKKIYTIKEKYINEFEERLFDDLSYTSLLTDLCIHLPFSKTCYRPKEDKR